MKINIPGGHITISDDSEESKKINQGYSYTIENGKIKLGKKTEFDKKSFKNKLKNKNATLDDIQEYLLTII